MYHNHVSSAPNSFDHINKFSLNNNFGTEKLRLQVRGAIDCEISVSLADSIGHIGEMFALPNCRYMYHNMILCPAMSFAFYNVIENDEITVLPLPETNCSISPKQTKSRDITSLLRDRFNSKYANNFSDPEAVFQQLQYSINPETAHESARLADLSRLRIETNPHFYRKICSRFESVGSLDEQIPRQIPTIVPPKPETPSTQHLPKLWKLSSSTNTIQSL